MFDSIGQKLGLQDVSSARRDGQAMVPSQVTTAGAPGAGMEACRARLHRAAPSSVQA
jgi:hypothetical protein